jgi:hypothetical protein
MMQLAHRYATRCGLLALAMLLTCYSIASPADFPALEVTYPSEGLVFSVGQPITIHWTGGDPEGSVSISLIDVNFNQVASGVTPDTPNDGSIEWTLPSNLFCGHTYEFYVQDARPAWSYGRPFTVACVTPPR